MATTRSSYGLFSPWGWSNRLISFLSAPSYGQSALTRCFGHGLHPAVVQPSSSIEHHALDAGRSRPFGDGLADALGPVDLVRSLRGQVRGRGEGAGAVIVDQLRVDVAVGPIDGQARSFGRSRHGLAHATVSPQASLALHVRAHLGGPLRGL